jgi:hypothetical protein
VNSGDCCSTATLPLHDGCIPRMYRELTANIPGCVAFSLPVQRRNLRSRRFQRLSALLFMPARCAATRERRFRARAVSGPISFKGRFSKGGIAPYPVSTSRICGFPGKRLQAPHLAFSDRQGGRFRRQRVPDGPTLDAPDCVADQDPRTIRVIAEPRLRVPLCANGIRFGAAPRVAFWPSPHPRIRWTVASPGGAIRAQGKPRPPPSRVTKCPTKC